MQSSISIGDHENIRDKGLIKRERSQKHMTLGS